jgi:PAS domain S-box-containing protein
MNVLVDITDRKQAELMLLGSELRFTQFMQHLRGLAWIKDFEGRYIFINADAEHSLAKSPSSFLGRTDEEIFPPQAAAQFRENDRKVLSSGKACETVEALELADGLHYWMVSKFPIPGPDGSSTRVGGIAIDVTESVNSREALLEADRRKDEFLATLAHELRNPLAPIRSALQLMRDPNHASPRLLEMLERQVSQMVRLVDDLLEVCAASRWSWRASWTPRWRPARRTSSRAATRSTSRCRPSRWWWRRIRCGWPRSSSTCSTTRRATRRMAATSRSRCGAAATT